MRNNSTQRFLASVVFVLGLFLFQNVLAQNNVQMANGTFESCGGALIDSGGQGGPGYSNDEYYTFTICPDVPGDVVTVDFVTFQLDQSGPQNSWDYLAIYDGETTGDTPLGSYTGNQLQGLFVSATTQNTSGCLTFVFDSNNVGTGNIGAAITCDTPCDRPIADATYDAPADKRICVGDVINFDGTASSAAPGFNLVSTVWDFGDGTTDDSGLITSHSWDEPGEYIVELFLEDDNGCASTNRVSLQVLVATYPSWEPFPGDAMLCLGEEITLEAFPEDYEVTWSGPEVTYSNSENVLLPDDVGLPFTSEIEVAGFAPGQTLDNINDLLYINALMNHSFLFDLVIIVSCPNGQSTILHQQMQQPVGGDVGANGTNLGVPGGEFYSYNWTPDATQGTWSQVATGLGDVLPEGDYNSLEPLDQLVGCELNGTWTIEITDLWGGDSGELSEWGLGFNPAIIPDVTEFTPQIGGDADSSFWSYDTTGLDITNASADGNSITVYPTEVGVYPFTFTLTNNHGCSSDSTVTVTVEQAGQADAGPDVTFCGPGTQLLGGLDGQPAPTCSDDAGNYTYCYDNSANVSFTYCPDNPGDGVTFMDITFNAGTVENGFDEFYVYDGDNTNAPLIEGPIYGNLAGMSWVATNPSGCITIELTPDGSVACANNGSQTEWNYDVGCTQGGDNYVYSWEPATGLSDPNTATPFVTELNGATSYTLTAYPFGRPDCWSTDEVQVLPAFDFNIEANDPSCLGNDGLISVFIDETTGVAPWTVELFEDMALVETVQSTGGTTDFDNLLPGNYSVTVSDLGGCSYTNDFVINGPQPTLFEVSDDQIICLTGTAVLEAWSEDDVNGTWTYTWDNGLGVGSSVSVSPAVTTTYTVFATDDNGCDADPLEVEVEVREPLSVEIDGPTMLCAGVNSQFEVINSDGGLAPYTYDWTYNGQAIGSGDVIDYQAAITGDYCVSITDACETPAVTACALLEIEQAIPVVFESDTTVACNPASIQFTSLVDETLYNSSLWNFGDGTGSSELNPAHGYGNPGLYDVSLQIVSNFGCTYNAEIQNMISILPAPQVGYDATPQPATVPDTEIQFFDASANDVVAYYWVFDTLNVLGTSTAQNPVFQFPYDVGGYYPVSLTVMDTNNCTNTVVRTIVVNDLFNLFIPNAFSPNNDGINDIFRIEGTDIDASRFKLQVFDRWGGIVFETTDPEVGWNGSYQTVNEEYYAQDGIYAWRVVVHSQSTTERKEFSGSVNLMR